MDRRTYGEIAPLDRSTQILRKLGRFREIIEAVDDHFASYPGAVTPNHAVFKRRAEAVANLAGEWRAPEPSKAKPEKTGDRHRPRRRAFAAPPEGALRSVPIRLACRAILRRASRLCAGSGRAGECLSGKREPCRSWLELEERFSNCARCLPGDQALARSHQVIASSSTACASLIRFASRSHCPLGSPLSFFP